MIGWSPVGANVKQKKELEVSQSVFYLEDGNNFGTVCVSSCVCVVCLVQLCEYDIIHHT